MGRAGQAWEMLSEGEKPPGLLYQGVFQAVLSIRGDFQEEVCLGTLLLSNGCEHASKDR
jgi:hypothetical protein